MNMLAVLTLLFVAMTFVVTLTASIINIVVHIINQKEK